MMARTTKQVIRRKTFFLAGMFFAIINSFACSESQKSASKASGKTDFGENETGLFVKEIAPRVKLNSGYEMPVLGLGTWTLSGATCENAVYSAIKSSYRLIDTAQYYGNEDEVGNALEKAMREGLAKREEIFITTKIVPWNQNPDESIDDSLKKLKVSYIDLVLLHQHGSGDDKVYSAIIKAKKAGKIRSIGISNFYTPESVSHFADDFEIPPSVVQNENHIYFQNTELRDWAKKHGILIESYYPFGGRGHTNESFQNQIIRKIAENHQKSSAQIIARWHIQSGFIAVPGSSNPSHIAENINIFDFELSSEEMNEIANLNRGKRYETW